MRRYSVYLLYWYKSTNTNAAAAGGYVDEAWRYLRDAGVDEEACSPYLQMEQAGMLN
jgi:hypothetical protein